MNKQHVDPLTRIVLYPLDSPQAIAGALDQAATAAVVADLMAALGSGRTPLGPAGSAWLRERLAPLVPDDAPALLDDDEAREHWTPIADLVQ